MSGYGPMASMANTGTSILSSLFSKDIGDYVGKTFDNPLIGKIAGIAIPALLAGGTGAALGGKYGWGNMLPAGIMSLMSQMGGDDESGVGGVITSPSQRGAALGEVKSALEEDPTAITGGKYLGDPAPQTVPKTQTATHAAQQPQKTAKSGTIMDSLGDLFNTPEGKILLSMIASNFTSGVLGNASGAEYEYNQRRNQAKDAYNKQMGDINYIRSWYQ